MMLLAEDRYEVDLDDNEFKKCITVKQVINLLFTTLNNNEEKNEYEE